MQRLYTIEIRVDFRDESKQDVMLALVKHTAHTAMASAGLLGDAIKPELAVYSHDYYAGHQDIELFDAAALSGEQAVTATSNPPDKGDGLLLKGA